MKNIWKFEDPQNVAAVTTIQVFKDKKPILCVSHDNEDGTWQFHSGDQVEVKDTMLVSLKTVVDYDPSVSELADLPLGWTADRKTVSGVWIKRDQVGTIMK